MKKSKTFYNFKYPNLIISEKAKYSLEIIYQEYIADENKEIGFIYGHRNKTTNLWYIGQSVTTPQNRWRINGEGYAQKNKNSKFVNAINKYGWDDFEHIILEFSLIENLNTLEAKYISEKNSFINGLNSTNGVGGAISDSVKRKLKGHSVSDKQISFITNLNKGKSSATKGLFLRVI